MIGGVDEKSVVRFQTKLMMGGQYGRVMNAKCEADIITACLRMAWNDAFRHVSSNRYKGEKESDVVWELYGGKHFKKNAKAGKDCKDMKKTREDAADDLGLNKKNGEEINDTLIISEYVCQKILHCDGATFRAFLDYAACPTTEEKVESLKEAVSKKELRDEFGKIKEVDGEVYPLCFGHLQKMFNMAMKLYLCLYMNREVLDIQDKMGESITEDMLAVADCPIDSVILKELDKTVSKRIKDVEPYTKVSEKKKDKGQLVPFDHFEEIKWSKIGADADELFRVEHYIAIQAIIREELAKKYGEGKVSNLLFDFENWN